MTKREIDAMADAIGAARREQMRGEDDSHGLTITEYLADAIRTSGGHPLTGRQRFSFATRAGFGRDFAADVAGWPSDADVAGML